MLENFLITIILFLGVFIFLVKKYPSVQDVLGGLLSDSLTRSTTAKSNHPLGSVFHKFNHDSAATWLAWILRQDINTKEAAFNNLVAHLHGSPKHWGFVTIEVVRAIAKFGKPENIDIIVNFMTQVRKLWGTYRSIPLYYETASQLLVDLDPYVAKQIFVDELALTHQADIGYEDKKRILIASLSTLKKGAGADLVLSEIISDKQELHSIRTYALFASEALVEEESSNVYRQVAASYLQTTESPLEEPEDLIYDRVADALLEDLRDEQTWKIVIKICLNPFLSRKILFGLREILASKKNKFSPERLYTLFSLPTVDKVETHRALALRYELIEDELMAILEPSINKNLLNQEYLLNYDEKPEVIVPKSLEPCYNKLSNCLSKQASPNEEGAEVQGGGVIIGGDSEFDKLYLIKALAHNRSWSFVYIDLNKILYKNDLDAVISLLENTPKPYIAYLVDISPFLGVSKANDDDMTQSLLAKLKKIIERYSVDPMFFAAAAAPGDIFDDSGLLKPKFSEICRDLLPHAYELESASQEFKLQTLSYYLDKLADNRELANFNIKSFMNGTEHMQNIEFVSFALDYIKVSLLVFGRLISIDQYRNFVAEHDHLCSALFELNEA